MSTYITTDVHGCFDSFKKLLDLIKFDFSKDRLINLGDSFDKGPKSKEFMDFLVDNNIEGVAGNHCEWFPRYCRGNKVKINNWRKDTIAQFGNDIQKYADYISNLPYYLQLNINNQLYTLVHAGIDATIPDMTKQHNNILMRIRTLPHENYEEGKKQVNPPWQYAYTNPFAGIIVHGHSICENPYWHGNYNVISIDGGCYTGTTRGFIGTLRCVRLEDRKIFEVPFQESEVRHYLSL